MEYLIYLFFSVGIFLVITGLFAEKGLKTDSRLPVIGTTGTKKTKIHIYLAPLARAGKVVLKVLKIEDKVRNDVLASHIKLSPAEFMGVKLLLIVAFPILSIFVFGKVTPPALFIGFALGYILPDFWLKRKISSRKQGIARQLPETVDLLGLCIEAGLDFTMAIKWIIDKAKPTPLLEELSFVLEEIKWGKPRSQALKDMARRLNIPEVGSFVQTLTIAERMGTPVSEAFTILSEDMRLHRFHQGERIAMKAPIKILIPLIFCILPVIGIVIGGPVLLQFLQGGALTTIGSGQ